MKSDALSARAPFFQYSQMLRLLLATVLVCATQAQVKADLLISAGSFSNLGGSGTTTGTSGTVSHSAGGATSTLASDARSSARFRVLKTYASASAAVSNGASTYAINHTFFQDDFLIENAALTGTQGFVEMRFTVIGDLQATRNANTSDWIFGADDNAYAQVEYQLTAESAGFFSSGIVRQRLYGRGDTEGTPFLNVEQVYLVPFHYGVPLNNVKLRVSNSAVAMGSFGSDFSSSSLSDQLHTTYWRGFGAVRDANGNLVTDYTFSSASAYDYVNGVPEPGSVTIIATVFGVLWTRRRRRIGTSWTQV